MFGTVVNPIAIQPGNSIATKSRLTTDPGTGDDIHVVIKARKVRKTEFCPGKPEMFHLDGECYDTRFATVIRVN